MTKSFFRKNGRRQIGCQTEKIQYPFSDNIGKVVREDNLYSRNFTIKYRGNTLIVCFNVFCLSHSFVYIYVMRDVSLNM